MTVGHHNPINYCFELAFVCLCFHGIQTKTGQQLRKTALKVMNPSEINTSFHTAQHDGSLFV